MHLDYQNLNSQKIFFALDYQRLYIFVTTKFPSWFLLILFAKCSESFSNHILQLTLASNVLFKYFFLYLHLF
jgi:hypothetical protein